MAAVVRFPSSDPGLSSFATNMSTKLSLAPTDYGCTTGDATSLATATDEFVAALALCNPANRSKPLTVDKDAKRLFLKNLIRQLALKIQGTPTVTDMQKADLGLSIPVIPSPIPAPEFPPAVDVVSVVGRTVTLKLHDSQETRRGKPPLCAGAIVFSFVGTEFPADPNQCKCEGITTKGKFDCVFPSSVPAGAQVWISASWYNGKAQVGPGATPITTYLQGGGSSEAAA